MKVISLNMALLSPMKMGERRSPMVLSDATCRALGEADIVCMNELKSGINHKVMEEQISSVTHRRARVLIPTATSLVGIVLIGAMANTEIELQEGVVQHGRAHSWRLHFGRALSSENSVTDQMIITVVYAPVQYSLRKVFFSEVLIGILQQLHDLSGEGSLEDRGKIPVIVTGDFNDYPTLMDMSAKNAHIEQRCWRKCIQSTLFETGFFDVFRRRNPDQLTYSFRFRLEDGSYSQRRLDNTLTNGTAGALIKDIGYSDRPLSRALDHCAILIDISGEGAEREHGRWRLHKNLLLSTRYRTWMEGKLREFVDKHKDKSPVKFLRSMVRTVREESVQFLTESREGWRQRALADNHKNLAGQLIGELSRGDDSGTVTSTVDDYVQAYTLKTSATEDKIRHRMQREERTPMAFTKEAIFNTRGSSARIETLSDPEHREQVTQTQSTIRKWVEKFYGKLYTLDDVVFSTSYDEEAAAFLQGGHLEGGPHGIKSSDARRLAKDLTDDEILSAAKSANQTSAAGGSGLPYQFWVTFQIYTIAALSAFCKALMNGEPLQAGEPMIPVTLLHKKGPKSDIRNYRPISLIDTHLRVILRAFTIKLAPMLKGVIPDLQTAFIPGRWIILNVLTIFMVLEAQRLGLVDGSESMMLSLDQEKAYDRVSRRWLWTIFRFYKLPDRLRRFYQSYYEHASARYSVNGTLTGLVHLACGLLQGDPSSTLLYILTLQPLLNRIQNEELGIRIQTAVFGGLTLTYVAFADDIWLFLKNGSAYSRFQAIMEAYARVTNSKLNKQKTRVHYLGVDTRVGHGVLGIEAIELADEFICLGIPMRRDGQLPLRTIEIALAKVENNAQWSGVTGFSLVGRVNAVNYLITSKLWYSLQIGPIEPWIWGRMRRFMTSYVFHSKRGYVAFPVICLPRLAGGLGLLDPEIMTTAMAGKWVAVALTQDSTVGRLFRMIYAEITSRTKGHPPIMMLVSPTSRDKARSEVSPFFRRVQRTMQRLRSSLSLKMKNYTEDQALSLPWHHEDLYTRNGMLRIGKGRLVSGDVNPTTSRLANKAKRFVGWTFRDILFWDLDAEEMVVPDRNMVDALIAASHNEVNRQDKVTNRELVSAWRYVGAHLGEYIRQRLPDDFRRKLLPQGRPECCNTVTQTQGGYVFNFADAKSFNLETMIPWHDVTLGDRPAKQYKVRKGREFMQKRRWAEGTRVFVPNHAIKFSTNHIAQIAWEKQWNELHVNWRPTEHIAIYYVIMHNRARLATDYTVVGDVETELWEGFVQALEDGDSDGAESEDSLEDPDYVGDVSLGTEEADEGDEFDGVGFAQHRTAERLIEREQTRFARRSYKTLICNLCSQGAKDSTAHAYAECDATQKYWQEIVPYLRVTMGPLSSAQDRAVQSLSSVSLRDVVFCFPRFKATWGAGSPGRGRIMLWHSCALAVIYHIREKAFTLARATYTSPVYHYEGADKLFELEYRLAIVDIYKEQRRLDQVTPRKKRGRESRVTEFSRVFLRGNGAVTQTVDESGESHLRFKDVIM